MYVPKYAIKENISRRLRGRLEVNDSPLFQGAAAKKVDDDLILQLTEQIEAKLDLALAQIYKLPIPATATQALLILGAIAEKLVISEIATTHFQQMLNPQMGGDMGYGATLRKEAREELESIFSGHGVYLPGITAPIKNPMMGQVPQPLVLPGVQLIPSSEQPDTFSRNYSYLAKRTESADDDPWRNY